VISSATNSKQLSSLKRVAKKSNLLLLRSMQIERPQGETPWGLFYCGRTV